MKFKLVVADTTGTFLVNPSLESLKQIKQEGHTIAKATCVVVEDDSDTVLYTVSITEYFDNKLIQTNAPTAENPSYVFDTLPGPLQTKITITCPEENEQAKQKLDKLAKHLQTGFYITHPYVAVMGGSYDRSSYMEIKSIAPLFADTIWEGLQSAPEFSMPLALVAELKSRTYQRALRADEEAIYTNIQSLIAESKYTEAVDAAYAVTNKRNEYDYLLSTTSDYLYQVGFQLHDKNLAESNRAFRLLSNLDMHCMHLLARKQLTQVAANKLSDPTLARAPRLAWAASILGSGLESGIVFGDDRDGYIEALKTLATKDGSVEMLDVPGAAEYGHVVIQSLDELKTKVFDGSSLAGTAFAGENAGQIEFGMAMMSALLNGMAAGIEANTAEATKKPATAPRPKNV